MPTEHFALSIVMPAFNEEATIERAVAEVLATEMPFRNELIVVDDGSEDRTAEILAGIDDPRLRLISHPVQPGEGRRLDDGRRGGVRHAPAAVRRRPRVRPGRRRPLVEPVLAGRASVVFGSRLSGMHTVYQSYRYAIGNRVMTLWANVLYDSAMTDIHTCLKLVPLPFFRGLRLRQRGFGLDTELAAGILASGARPFEVPVAYYGRSHDDGKKITWRDGVECLWILVRSRLHRRGRHAVPTPRVWTPAEPVHEAASEPQFVTNGLRPDRARQLPRHQRLGARLVVRLRPPDSCARPLVRRPRDRVGARRDRRASPPSACCRRPRASRVSKRSVPPGSSGGLHRAVDGARAHGDGVGLDPGRGVRHRDPRRPGRRSRLPLAARHRRRAAHGRDAASRHRVDRRRREAHRAGARPVRCDDGAARVWVGARVDPQPAQSVGTWLDLPGAPA